MEEVAYHREALHIELGERKPPLGIEQQRFHVAVVDERVDGDLLEVVPAEMVRKVFQCLA